MSRLVPAFGRISRDEKPADDFRRPADGRYDDVVVQLSRDLCCGNYYTEVKACCIHAFASPFSFCIHCFVIIVLFTYHDARASGNTALSSPFCDLLATMRRVVNYHSSWARQRQVELLMRLLLSVLGFDPMSLWVLVVSLDVLFSGNPGFTAGRGFSPAGGAPGGG
ncbi:hypothetical protein F511_15159 [Dorcoceras hygrometricum]|uniref:Uncharacterized protein n=1 Tax=Dorcoceras hygrometricum TaxID=472368 RepID=A0A2Z7BH69_9LAMI|nr:hypothetical protein F511_15159 [Dorcoceras hygrometricum]